MKKDFLVIVALAFSLLGVFLVSFLLEKNKNRNIIETPDIVIIYYKDGEVVEEAGLIPRGLYPLESPYFELKMKDAPAHYRRTENGYVKWIKDKEKRNNANDQ